MTRAEMIELLRNTGDWPEGFTWNYWGCKTCAIGLYARVTGDDPESLECDEKMKRELGIERDSVFASIFYEMMGCAPVTPDAVADALERLEACGV